MTTEHLIQEDARKIHAEVNQILNQRHLLTTLAITIFGVFAAWGLPNRAGSIASETIMSTQSNLAELSAIFLFIILTLIYLVSHNLRKYMSVLTIYLDVSDLSKWEKDWSRFRDDRYFAYTKTQALFFAILGVLTFIYPIIFDLYTISTQNHPLIPFCKKPFLITLFIIYEIVIFFLGFSSRSASEKLQREQWERILQP